ncbi:hypothetical protein K440DRAFT_409944 [Wilcoxina mikolae CBS 423.85]|nr:hypothetical protein K440DRAFT_409944 [Wilcoxina mikolae CBS 423.85]
MDGLMGFPRNRFSGGFSTCADDVLVHQLVQPYNQGFFPVKSSGSVLQRSFAQPGFLELNLYLCQGWLFRVPSDRSVGLTMRLSASPISMGVSGRMMRVDLIIVLLVLAQAAQYLYEPVGVYQIHIAPAPTGVWSVDTATGRCLLRQYVYL